MLLEIRFKKYNFSVPINNSFLQNTVRQKDETKPLKNNVSLEPENYFETIEIKSC